MSDHEPDDRPTAPNTDRRDDPDRNERIEEAASDGLPDPDDIEPLGPTDGVYQRDADGRLKPLDWEVIDWGGRHKKVRYYPVPIGDSKAFADFGDTLEIEEICDILAEKVHTPDRTAEEWSDTDTDQFNAVVMGLIRAATGEEPADEFHEQVREELADRQDTAGNEDAT